MVAARPIEGKREEQLRRGRGLGRGARRGLGSGHPDLGFSPFHGTTTETSDADERQPLSLAAGPTQKWAQAS